MSLGDQRVATAVDIGAAAILAAAVAFSTLMLAGGVFAAVLAPLAFIVAYAALGRLDGAQARPIAAFAIQPIDPPQPSAAADDDNVVRLFEPRQLAIARPSAAVDPGSHDAGQALSEALAQLKRSLR